VSRPRKAQADQHNLNWIIIVRKAVLETEPQASEALSKIAT
jgi:hypothetical protein